MISGSSVYHVLEAMVPLYVAMGLGYASIRRGALSPEQCAGINHFVALLAVPLLIFRMIAANNPYAMNLRFLAADTLQKSIILAALGAWGWFSRRGSLAWVITLFSLATLPNTVIMGMPILRGMYGHVGDGLMVQIVVLQFVIWYAIVVFLLEYKSAAEVVSQRQRVDVSNPAVVVSISEDGAVPEATAIVPDTPTMKQILIMAGRKVLKIPSTYASLLGLVWSLIAFRLDIKMPEMVDSSLSIISVSAIGLSTFSIGTFMARRKQFISCSYSLAAMAMAMRFLVGPAIMSISSLAVGLRGQLLHIGIVQAALPLAVLSFVYSEEYHVHPEIMSTGVIVGIFLSVPITILYYVLLEL